jgi:hypothetical protein
MLRHSLRSIQQQTVCDLEIFVVGDGVPDVTREVLADLGRDDPRIRFFDNPKGSRHGELHRHAALQSARGDIVCYQADDDLWRPDQVAQLHALLSKADFAHTVALQVEPDGSFFPLLAILEARAFRGLMHGGLNFLPLCAVGHTLAAYRALPYGWRTTPRGIPTDLYMWQQFLDQPGIRLASGTRPTVLHFPTPRRREWTLEERLRELERWEDVLAGTMWHNDVEPSVSEWCEAAARRLRKRLRRLERLSAASSTRPLLCTIPRRFAIDLWRWEVWRFRRSVGTRAPTEQTTDHDGH